MAQKSKANARQKHTRADQIVVNIYNHGTVNIDARQNNSRTFRHENNGCTFKAPDYATSGKAQGEILMLTDEAFVAATCQVVELMVDGSNIRKKNSQTIEI